MDDSGLLECIGEIWFIVKKGLLVGGCTCYLGTWCGIRLLVGVCILRGYWAPDIAGDFGWRRWWICYLRLAGFGWVYVYYLCTGHRLLQETLDGEDDGYAILGWLLEVTICEVGTFFWWMYALSGFRCYRRFSVDGCIPWDETISMYAQSGFGYCGVWTGCLGSDVTGDFGWIYVYARRDCGTYVLSGFRYCWRLWSKNV